MSDPAAHRSAWLRAAADPAISAALELVFAEAADAIAARGPACWASGRCCNFDAAGHRLYTTALEAAYTVVRLAPPPAPPLPVAAVLPHALALPQIAAARARGGCPFQQANLCGVHTIKPLACRVYFCDRSAQDWQRDLSERLHERLRGLHAEFGVPYLYAEWRALLEIMATA